MSLLDRVFRRRRRDLSSVDGPTRVQLSCTVVSPNDIVSPVTGFGGSLIRWSLLEKRSHQRGQGDGVNREFRVLEQGCFGRDNLVLAHDGRTLAVPLSTARLVLVEDLEDGKVLTETPAEFADIMRRLDTTRPIAYRETSLQAGDRVELTATVEPNPKGGYREAARRDIDLRALATERIVLRELTPS